jgi:hypothetical protein
MTVSVSTRQADRKARRRSLTALAVAVIGFAASVVVAMTMR